MESSRGHGDSRWVLYGAAVLSAVCSIAVNAQEPRAPDARSVPAPPELSAQGTSQLVGTEPSFGPWAVPNLLHWGPVRLRPHVLYRFSHGNGLQARPGQAEDSIIQEVHSGLLLELGDRWTLDYTPSLHFYSSSLYRDTLDHAVALNGGTVYRNWSFGLSQRSAISAQPLVETGSQTGQETHATGINASCQLGSNLSLDLGINQSFRFQEQDAGGLALNDSRQWSSMNWLNYRAGPHLGLALGAGGGYVDVSTGANMTYEQLQARVNWWTGNKLRVTLHGGAENRQFLDSAVPDALNPIVGLDLEYQWFEQTELSLSATRSVDTSLFRNQITESTRFSGALSQRLLGKLNLTVNGGYGMTSFRTTAAGLAAGREDHRYFVGARLGMGMLKRANVSVFYQFSENVSGQSGFSYATRQAGFEIAYRF